MKRAQLAVLAAIGAVVMLTLLAGAYFQQSRKQQAEQRTSAQEIEASITRGGDQPRVVTPPVPPKSAPTVVATKAQPPKPRVSDATHSWLVPFAKEDKMDDSEYEIRDCAVDAEGTRLLAKTKRDVSVIDLGSGKTLQVFRATPRDNRQPGSETLFPAPDARCVAVISTTTNKPPRKVVQFLDTGTGQPISTATLENDLSYNLDWINFTPSGRRLLVPGRLRGKHYVQIISVDDGGTRTIPLPGESQDGSPRWLLPVANLPQMIVYGLMDKTRQNPSLLSWMDFQEGSQRLIKSISVKPFFLFSDHGVVVSPDGKYVLASDPKKFQLCDWREDRLVFERTEGDINYTLPRFTPDGRRFVAQRTPLYFMMYFGGPKGGQKESVPVMMELYDISSAKKIAEYTMPVRATAMAISANGNTIAYVQGHRVYAVDFRGAFGIDRLPPMPPAVDVDFPVK